jgi:hypothetical protein
MTSRVRKSTFAAAVALAALAGCVPAGDPPPGDLPGTDAAPPPVDAGPPPIPETCNGLDDDGNGVADDGDVCPCPARWYGGHVYLFCEQRVAWLDALGGCAYVGYHLLAVDDAGEDAWACETADSFSGQEWWMGMNDRDAEGAWVWEDGDPVAYTNWEQSGCCGVEPNDFFGEDCAVLNFYPDTWNDLPCEDEYRFVCEAP